MKLSLARVEPLIRLSLKEDIGKCDLTTNSTVPRRLKVKAVITAKEEGIICGLELIKFIFKILNEKVSIYPFKKDGDLVKKREKVVILQGKARAILSTERIILNFLQQLSGVATMAHQYADKIKRYKTKILDTRKTIPGMRYLQKYAVKCGGAENHRRGLYDMVLIKDNHLYLGGSLKKAVKLARKKNDPRVKIEVECASLDQVKEALETDCNWIMLDNLSLNEIKEALKLIKKKKIVEVSGRMNLEKVVEIAKLGVDYISVGALTHSAPALDLSMEVKVKE